MLTCERITKRFGATTALSDASLDVGAGEFVCLLGPSGCGKSTLLRIVAGLAMADEGRILIDGVDVTSRAANTRPTAMVFQSHALWGHMSVARNVGFGLRVRRTPPAEMRARVEAALALVGLDGLAGRRPHQLSGGQAQRVALARCLVVEPRVLLMDEPFSALDAHLRQRLRGDLKALQRRLGLTTLFVTHDQEEAMELADRIAVMNEGVIQQVGPPGALYLSPETAFVARFIGATNETTAEIRAGRTAWHGVPLAAPVPDGPAELFVRHEDVLPAAEGAEGRIERVIDLGPVLRAEARMADGAAVTLTAQRDRMRAPGAAVRLVPRRVSLFRDGRRLCEAAPPAIPAPIPRAVA
jgi:putative spermidine/putrescine transport system ATP-binding protein